MDELDAPLTIDRTGDDPRQRLEAMIRVIAEQTRLAIEEATLRTEFHPATRQEPAVPRRRRSPASLRRGVAAWVRCAAVTTRH